MPPSCPKVKVPSLANDIALVTEEPLPVKATLATVLSTTKVVTSTSAESVAVPPTLASVKVVTPAMAPLAVMSALAILFSVVRVKVLVPPVTAAMVMSARLVVVELVSMIVALPSVTAPNVIASSEPVSYTHMTLPTICSV